MSEKKVKIYHPNCRECEFWVYHTSVGGWHCESGFRPLVRDDWPYDCREMARSNRKARLKLAGGFIELTLF